MSEEEGRKKKVNKNLIVAICGVVAAVILVVLLLVFFGRGGRELTESDFVSDGTKLVLTIESDPAMRTENEQEPINSHLVYYYSGENITNLKVYYQYENATKAKTAYDILHDSNNGQYKDVLLDGRYVVLVAQETEYNYLKTSDVKQQIDFMESMKGMSQEGLDGGEAAPEEVSE